MLLGYSRTKEAYRLWDVESLRIAESRDVRFDEGPTRFLFEGEPSRTENELEVDDNTSDDFCPESSSVMNKNEIESCESALDVERLDTENGNYKASSLDDKKTQEVETLAQKDFAPQNVQKRRIKT